MFAQKRFRTVRHRQGIVAVEVVMTLGNSHGSRVVVLRTGSLVDLFVRSDYRLPGAVAVAVMFRLASPTRDVRRHCCGRERSIVSWRMI